MYINVNLQTINLAGSGIVYNADDNLYDLFAQYGDDRIQSLAETVRSGL